MKRLTFILALLICSNLLIACDPPTYYFGNNFDSTDVAQIQLIHYDNNDSKIVYESYEALQPFDNSKATVIETLGDEYIDTFVQKISGLCFMFMGNHHDSPQGICLRFTFHDTSFLIMGCEYDLACHYDSSGNVVNFWGERERPIDLINITNQFFDYKL